MSERPERQRGLRFGYLLLTLLGLIALAGIAFTVLRPPSPEVAGASTAAALALVGMAVVGYGIRGLYSAHYHVDRNGLTLTWWPAVYIIPMHAIRELRPGPTSPRALEGWRGLRWPGLYIGHARTAEEGRPVLFLATAGPAQQLWVLTEAAIYAISPRDPAAFREAFAQRAALGPTQRLPQTTLLPPWRQRAFWGDRAAWGVILLGGLVLWGMWVWLCWRFPDLPAWIPLEGSTAPDLLSPTAHLSRLPALGALVWAVHAVLGGILHERERPAAYGLWLIALLVQILLLGALLRLAPV